MRHWIWIVLALLTSAPTATATEVIVILTKDGALLSADSLEIISGKSPVQACKIHQTGCLLWIAAGSIGDTGTGFDVGDFFVQRAANKCDVRKNLNHLDSRLTTALQKEVPRIKQLQPEYYQKLLRGGYILSLFAAGVRRGKVEAYEKDFSFVNGLVHPTPATTCAPPCLLITRTTEVLGYANSHPVSGDAVSLTDKLMQIAQSADPDYVGPPTSILVLRNDGPRWIRQNNCPDIKPFSEEAKTKQHH
jgi:hypothetical protein